MDGLAPAASHIEALPQSSASFSLNHESYAAVAVELFWEPQDGNLSVWYRNAGTMLHPLKTMEKACASWRTEHKSVIKRNLYDISGN